MIAVSVQGNFTAKTGDTFVLAGFDCETDDCSANFAEHATPHRTEHF
jgi:hypothetical protein